MLLSDTVQPSQVNRENFMAIWMFAVRQCMSNKGINLSPNARAKFISFFLKHEQFITTDIFGTKILNDTLALGELMQIFFDYSLANRPSRQDQDSLFQEEIQTDEDTFSLLPRDEQVFIIEAIRAYATHNNSHTDSKHWERLIRKFKKADQGNFISRLFNSKSSSPNRFSRETVANTNPEFRQSLLDDDTNSRIEFFRA